VSDWRTWVAENVAYARTSLPEILDPEALVVIGLKAGHAARKSLAQLNRELGRIRIVTFDELGAAAQQYLDNLRVMSRRM